MPNVSDNPVSENRQPPPPETEAQAYLRQHAVDFAVAAEAGVWAHESAIFFPYKTPDGTTYERERRFHDGITRQPKGQELSLYWPLGRARNAPILLCEGEADTLAAASVLANTDHHFLDGICPVGLPGASFPMGRACLEIGDCRPIYICLDPDEAGSKAAQRLVLEVERKLVAKTVVCHLPEGKDLSDCLVAIDEADRAEWLANLLADHDAATDGSDQLVAADVKERLAS